MESFRNRAKAPTPIPTTPPKLSPEPCVTRLMNSQESPAVSSSKNATKSSVAWAHSSPKRPQRKHEKASPVRNSPFHRARHSDYLLHSRDRGKSRRSLHAVRRPHRLPHGRRFYKGIRASRRYLERLCANRFRGHRHGQV